MTHEIRVVKSTSQNVAEWIEVVLIFGATFYFLRPDVRDKHLAFVRKQMQVAAFWVSVQSTLASIRSLPETRS